MTTPLLAIAELASSQAQKEVTANEAFRVLEAFTNPRFLDRDLATPPGSPAESDMYLVAASPTGAWSGQAAKIALYLGGAWRFFTPYEGLFAWVNDEDKLIRYAGGAWAEFTSGGSSYTDEQARDAIGTALVAGTGITVTVNDGSDTITIASTVSAYTDEQVRDVVGATLVEGDGIDIAVDDVANTITITADAKYVSISQAGYDALGTYDAGTLYLIPEA